MVDVDDDDDGWMGGLVNRMGIFLVYMFLIFLLVLFVIVMVMRKMFIMILSVIVFGYMLF